jgi:hypothetical protein
VIEEPVFVEVPPKKKRVMSEKQREALKRGREKKLAINHSSKKAKLALKEEAPVPETKEEENKENIQPNLEELPPNPPKLKRCNAKKPKKKPPPPPSSSSSEESAVSDSEESEGWTYPKEQKQAPSAKPVSQPLYTNPNPTLRQRLANTPYQRSARQSHPLFL